MIPWSSAAVSAELKKYPGTPPTVVFCGGAYCCAIAYAIGSNELVGIVRFPDGAQVTQGVPLGQPGIVSTGIKLPLGLFVGSWFPVIAVKEPASSAGLNVLVKSVVAVALREPWYARKKKSLSLSTGPPRVPPYTFW